MTRLLMYLLFITVFNSCISKKYGRHFNNQTRSSIIIKQSPIEKNPEFIASSDGSIPLKIIVDEYHPEPQSENSNKVGIDKVQRLDSEIPAMKTKKQKRKVGRKGGEDNSQKRKMEPLGLASTGLFVIASLIGFSMGFTPLILVLIGLSMLGGALSVHKINLNKKRWKGRFFGIFVILTGVVLLLLLGISAFFLSIFGGT